VPLDYYATAQECNYYKRQDKVVIAPDHAIYKSVGL
jgi:hypothetical protein